MTTPESGVVPGVFVCPRCKQQTDDVGKRPNHGRQSSNSYCRPCQKEYSAQWYRRNRRRTLEKNKARSRAILDWLSVYKTERGCAECGYNSHACALDFHHLNEEDKLFALNEAQQRRDGSAKIRREAEKCIILCANCHRVHHHTKGEKA